MSSEQRAALDLNWRDAGASRIQWVTTCSRVLLQLRGYKGEYIYPHVDHHRPPPQYTGDMSMDGHPLWRAITELEELTRIRDRDPNEPKRAWRKLPLDVSTVWFKTIWASREERFDLNQRSVRALMRADALYQMLLRCMRELGNGCEIADLNRLQWYQIHEF